MKLAGTGIQFVYDPKETRASTSQIVSLLEGLGYHQTMCVHDDDTGEVEVSGLKYGEVALPDNGHEVNAIRHVIAQALDIDYLRVGATEKVTYTKEGETLQREL